MSELSSNLQTNKGETAYSRPAVGLIATQDNGDEIAGAILRARQKGHEAIVMAAGGSANEAVAFAKELGAIVVEQDFAMGHSRSGTQHCTSVARDVGFPGVILHENLSQPLDYKTSVGKLRDSSAYAIEGELSTAIESEPRTLAAIPAYNEEQSIYHVVSTAREHADEVLVVDDGSTDETVERAREAGATVVVHEDNRGYGGALKTAFVEAERAGVEYLVILDGDGQHDASDIPRLIENQQDTRSEIVIGSRFCGGSDTKLPLHRYLGLRVVNFMTNLSFGVVRSRSRVADTQSGFRLYTRKAIGSLAADETIGNRMGASTDILHHAHRKRYEITEVGTTVSYDVQNASTHNPVSHGIHLVMNIVRTIEEQRPISVLGVPGFLSAVVGLGFAYLTFSNFINSGLFPLGLALVSVFFTLAGIFACFTAIILHSLNQHFPD
ncbi:glycosyltransferase family 2 protein [Haladaptatus sp. GCM10025707]|uniref:glycosyltransferase family 2 protein n=1 Tax=unclassified Haladaptatus TaxID=2622732 RepID=UPI0023E8670A|nr:glycosyltransferase family 2 protein [Haladaptatus sp. QDMS2]